MKQRRRAQHCKRWQVLSILVARNIGAVVEEWTPVKNARPFSSCSHEHHPISLTIADCRDKTCRCGSRFLTHHLREMIWCVEKAQRTLRRILTGQPLPWLGRGFRRIGEGFDLGHRLSNGSLIFQWLSASARQSRHTAAAIGRGNRSQVPSPATGIGFFSAALAPASNYSVEGGAVRQRMLMLHRLTDASRSHLRLR